METPSMDAMDARIEFPRGAFSIFRARHEVLFPVRARLAFHDSRKAALSDRDRDREIRAGTRKIIPLARLSRGCIVSSRDGCDIGRVLLFETRARASIAAECVRSRAIQVGRVFFAAARQRPQMRHKSDANRHAGTAGACSAHVYDHVYRPALFIELPGRERIHSLSRGPSSKSLLSHATTRRMLRRSSCIIDAYNDER